MNQHFNVFRNLKCPIACQAIAWTNAHLLSTGPGNYTCITAMLVPDVTIGNKLEWNLIQNLIFHGNRIHWNISYKISAIMFSSRCRLLFRDPFTQPEWYAIYLHVCLHMCKELLAALNSRPLSTLNTGQLWVEWCTPLIFPFMFMMLAWTNSRRNSRMAGDLRRYDAHMTSL